MDFDEVKKILEDYQEIKTRIQVLREDLESINRIGISAINFNGGYEETVSKPTKIEAKKTAEYKIELENTISLLEKKIIIIDKAVEILPDNYKAFIKMKLIKKISYYQVCTQLHISERYARKIKKRAIQKIVSVVNQGK